MRREYHIATSRASIDLTIEVLKATALLNLELLVEHQSKGTLPAYVR